MTDLSPAAQAVLDAFLGDCEHTGLQMDDLRENVAAALRTAADQVVPQEEPPADFLDHAVAAEIDQRRVTHAQLLAIADELEQS
jgi:hypothetical protein